MTPQSAGTESLLCFRVKAEGRDAPVLNHLKFLNIIKDNDSIWQSGDMAVVQLPWIQTAHVPQH